MGIMNITRKAKTLKQPQVFYLACATAICERFGFYVLSFLLVIYAKSVFHVSDDRAFALFAVFNALVYITPAIGGYLADNYFGIRRSIVLGLFLEGLGLSLLAAPSQSAFYLGLIAIPIGVGFFKTAPTNLMARAYTENDPRIDSGFTLFYMSINIGSFLASLVCGYVLRGYGWSGTFLMAGLALFLGLLAYFSLRKSAAKNESPAGMQKLTIKVILGVLAGLLIVAAFFGFMLHHLQIANMFFIITTILVALYFTFEIIRSPKKEKFEIIACLFLILIGLVFFILYFQYYESITLFIERCVVHKIFNIDTPMPVFLSFNATWIIILSPILAWVYRYLGKFGKDLSVTTKFPLGLLITSLCFFTLFFSGYFLNADAKISGSWVFLAIFFYSFGELLVSALGVAMVARIAPSRMYGVMMGAWFLISTALASSVSGKVAEWASIPANMQDPFAIFHVYMHAFLRMGFIGLIVAIAVFFISPYVKRIADIE